MFLFLFFFVKYFFMTALLQPLVLRVLDKVVLKMFSNLTGKFSCDFCEISKHLYSELLRTTAFYTEYLFGVNILHLCQSETTTRKEKSLLENIRMKVENILHYQYFFISGFGSFGYDKHSQMKILVRDHESHYVNKWNSFFSF